MLKVLYKKIQHFIPMDFTRVLLWQIDTGNGLDNDHENDKEHFCQLTENQLLCHSENPQYELSTSVASSVADKQVMCFGVYVDNTLAGYVFFCGSPVEAARNSGGGNFTGIALSFPDDVCYLYKMLVLPEYRGHKLASKLIRFAAITLATNSVTHIVTTTDWTNASFLKSTVSMGFKALGIAGEYVILGRRRYILPAAIVISGNAESIELTKP